MSVRDEIIDFLIRSDINVTEKNIDKYTVINLNQPHINAAIDINNGINNTSINKIYDFVSRSMMKSVDTRSEIESKFKNTNANVLKRFDFLYRNIETALEEVKIAQVLESKMSGYSKTISLDFDNITIVDQDETTATISDGIVIGKTNQNIDDSFADKSSIKINEYDSSLIDVSISYRGNSKPGFIELINDSGIGTIPGIPFGVINSYNQTRVSGISDISGEKCIKVLIDKQDQEYFNQIEMKLGSAELCSIFTSDDGTEFTKIFDKKKYVKNTILPINNSNARFVKILFYKNDYDSIVNGKYVYRVMFNELNILSSTNNKTSVFQTNEISTQGNYSAIALTTCCNTNKDNRIDYSISIDGGVWNSISSIGKYQNTDFSKPISLPINQYTDNRLISLKEFVKNENIDEYLSTVEIPGEFLQSNSIRVFSEDISKSSSDWSFDGRFYTAYGILLNDYEIDFRSKEIELNGKWAAGKVPLSKGVYKIRTYSENYINLFNTSNSELLSEINGEYTVKGSDGVIRTIVDPIYPNNHKVIIEERFDFIFKDELVEKEDYSVYNRGTTYGISTTKLHEEVVIAYKLHTKSMTNFRLRAELTSISGTTIPFIEKAILRLA